MFKQAAIAVTPTLVSMVVEAKNQLLMDATFTRFEQEAHLKREVLLPQHPRDLEALDRIQHIDLLTRVLEGIRVKVRKQYKVDNDRRFDSRVIGYKSYIEGWCHFPPKELVNFYAYLIANNIRVSHDWEVPGNAYRGISRVPIEPKFVPRKVRKVGILMSDSSVPYVLRDHKLVAEGLKSNKLDIEDIVGGGGFVIWPDGGDGTRFVLRGGPLEYLGPIRQQQTGICHPLADNKLVIYELHALLEALIYNEQYLKLNDVRIFVDSLGLQRVLTGRYSVPEMISTDIRESERYYADFMLAFSLLRQLRARVDHLHREGNILADYLAFLGQQRLIGWEDREAIITHEVLHCLRMYRDFDNVVRFN